MTNHSNNRDANEPFRLPAFLRGSVLLDLFPLWVSVVGAVALLDLKRFVGQGPVAHLSEEDFAFDCLWGAGAAALLAGIWPLLRLGSVMGRVTRLAFREEIALTYLKPAEVLNAAVRRRLERMKSAYVLILPVAAAGIMYLFEPSSHSLYFFEYVVALVFGSAFVSVSLFVIRLPDWAVAHTLARMCRGRGGSVRRVLFGWAALFALVPLVIVPLCALAIVWILQRAPVQGFVYSFARSRDLYFAVPYVSPEYDGTGTWCASGRVMVNYEFEMATGLTHLVVYALFLVPAVTALWLLYGRAGRLAWPRRLRLLLLCLICYLPAVLFALAMDHNEILRYFMLAFVPPFIGWCFFVRLVVRKSQTSWAGAVERYFTFE